jgi:3-methylcrotonyl-CoA carboxylase alpha subunit
MKMEHSIEAPDNGLVTEFYFQAGDLVDSGTELLSFEVEHQGGDQ